VVFAKKRNNARQFTPPIMLALCAEWNLPKRIYLMRKVVLFSKAKKWWHESPDVDLLNAQITDIEKDDWSIVSVSANTNFLGFISSYTILIELLD
jgi:hypothetical protein